MKKMKFLVLTLAFVVGFASCDDEEETVVYKSVENSREGDGLKGNVKWVETIVYDATLVDKNAEKGNAKAKSITYYSKDGLKSGEVKYEVIQGVTPVDFRVKEKTELKWDDKFRVVSDLTETYTYYGVEALKQSVKEETTYDDAKKQAVWILSKALNNGDFTLEKKRIYALNSFGFIDKDNYQEIELVAPPQATMVSSDDAALDKDVVKEKTERVIVGNLDTNGNWTEGYLKNVKFDADGNPQTTSVFDYQIRTILYW